MRFKLIVVFVEDAVTEEVAGAAKAAGATGCTRIYSASGEGAEETKTFLGLTLESQRDVLMLLVEEHQARHILEAIGQAGQFDETPGTGIAFQVDVEDAIGVAHQAEIIKPMLKKAGL
jgi:hypothetical protein